MKHLHLIIVAAAAFLVLAVVAGNAAAGLLPLALFALCPLAMVFIMRGMHSPGAGAAPNRDDDRTR